MRAFALSDAHVATQQLLLWTLTGLFLARVLGQLAVLLWSPRWLPPMDRWYSGLMAYRYLLPSQVAILAFQVWWNVAVASGEGLWGVRRPVWGLFLLAFAGIYFGAMVARFVRWWRQPPDQRGVLIPILFHWALAAYVWVLASWNLGPG